MVEIDIDAKITNIDIEVILRIFYAIP